MPDVNYTISTINFPERELNPEETEKIRPSHRYVARRQLDEASFRKKLDDLSIGVSQTGLRQATFKELEYLREK